MLLLFEVAFLFNKGTQPSLTLNSAMHFVSVYLKISPSANEVLLFSLMLFSISWKLATFFLIVEFQ